jgi:ubiquinone/menaquinone biosynthesis C-methylase UbiE
VKLSDPTRGLSGTPLEQVSLEDQTLGGYRKFWEQSASVDAVGAIADQETVTSFEVSGKIDAEALVAMLPDPDAVVLEIGCGTGRVMQHLSGLYREVHGIDISSEMVKQGERRLGHLPNVHFHHGNGYDLDPLPDGSFDLVYSAFVFQHMPKTTVYNYFLESMRVLRPGGLFRLQVPNLLNETHFAEFNHFAQPWFVEHPYPMYFWTPAEVVWLLTRAGFWVEELDQEMVVKARRTGTAGAPAELLERTLGAPPEHGRSSGQIPEPRREADRHRRSPVVRLAAAARRAIRRGRRPAG